MIHSNPGAPESDERRIFLAILDCDDEAVRASLLDEACDGNKELRRRIEGLLESHRASSDFLDGSAGPVEEVVGEYIRRGSDESSPSNRSGPTTSSSSSAGQWSLPDPESLQDLLPGYRIEELVGCGGMGAVYRGIQASLERPVAIKILRPDISTDPAFAERFRHEAFAMARLAHPNLVAIHDYGSVVHIIEASGEGAQTEVSVFFLVMEFVDGADLHHLIRTGDLDCEAALSIVGQVCDALAYAHSQGYVHRDIKPANIFVTRHGAVKVGDFGLAKLSNSGTDPEAVRFTQTGFLVGTPHYMAPENVSLEGSVDHRADIFSLGVMFYEMLTGELPRGSFPPPSKKVPLDVRLDEVVMKAMESDPDQRYQDISEVKIDIERISSSQIRAGTVEDPEQSKSRSRGLGWLGKCAAMAVALFLIVLAVRSVFNGRESMAPIAPSTLDPDLAAATRDEPFENSLGMKFVPVPGTDVLFCIHETRWKDYAAFAEENPGVAPDWRDQTIDGVEIDDSPEEHPAKEINWHDAKAFCAWLSKREGKVYRLATDREWSVAVGIGRKEQWWSDTTPATVNKIQDAFPWGGVWPPPAHAGNYGDDRSNVNPLYRDGYNDGYPTTAPVMRFGPNQYGLYDLGGNVWEWVEDRWSDSNKEKHTLRGAGWRGTESVPLLASHRGRYAPTVRGDDRGFRVVVETGAKSPFPAESTPPAAKGPVSPPPAKRSATPDPALTAATGDTPFENSLGMKFVSVPETDVLFCVHETRRKDYGEFANANPEIAPDWRDQTVGGDLIGDRAGDHPVVKVSWHDAKAFCVWLSGKEGRSYRLPTDREWSVAVGIGSREIWRNGTTPETVTKELDALPWKGGWPPPPGAGNYSDRRSKADPQFRGGHDVFPTTAPVMRFDPNRLGLYDMGGNVWEWVEDRWNDSNADRTLRGASWRNSESHELISSHRIHYVPTVRGDDRGFRVVVETGTQTPVSAAATSPPKPVKAK